MASDPTPPGARNVEDWELQFMIEAERAQEYVELFESLGSEVLVQAVDPVHLQKDECSACLMSSCERYVVIYTRRKHSEGEA